MISDVKRRACRGPKPIDICDNEYHRLPVIPRNGSMTFEHNDADDALATIKSILSNAKVNLTISWECVSNDNQDCIIYSGINSLK